MKKINWKIAAFAAWIVMTFMVIDAGLKGVSKADWKRSTDDDACQVIILTHTITPKLGVC